MGDTPASGPTVAVKQAEQVAELVRNVELELIYALKRTVTEQMGASAYQALQLADLSVLLARVNKILGRDWQTVLDEAQKVLDQARTAGQGQAKIDLGKHGRDQALPTQIAAGIELTAIDLLTALTGMTPLILREVADQYQKLMSGPVTSVTSGAFTRTQATEQALIEWARRGIPGFVDRGGRNWTMDAYAEMAVRTGGLNALREGYWATVRAGGEDLVAVTGHGYTCPKCATYQGKVLSLGRTPPGVHMYEDILNPGTQIPVEVAATVDEATKDGLFHPNCAHSTYLYIPGASTTFQGPPNVETYEKSQQQRALEVEVRRVKREMAAAITEDTLQTLRADKRELQTQIRELVAQNPMLARKPLREQIKTAH